MADTQRQLQTGFAEIVGDDLLMFHARGFH